jgi:hypothetical protein
VETLCGVELGMTKEHLDHADIDILLEQVGSKAVPQGMGTDPLPDAGGLGSLLHCTMQLPGGNRIGVTAAGEQLAMWEHHAHHLPSRHHIRSSSKRCGDIPPTLALFHPQQNALAVDIVDLEVCDLRYP